MGGNLRSVNFFHAGPDLRFINPTAGLFLSPLFLNYESVPQYPMKSILHSFLYLQASDGNASPYWQILLAAVS
jgi:hypothetical protein